jgi:hypothetical protein
MVKLLYRQKLIYHSILDILHRNLRFLRRDFLVLVLVRYLNLFLVVRFHFLDSILL